MHALLWLLGAVGLFVFMAVMAGLSQAVFPLLGLPIPNDVAARSLGAAAGVVLVLSWAAWRAKR